MCWCLNTGERGDSKRALDTLATLEEEGIVPSAVYLNSLATYLREAGQNVPFDVPEKSVESIDQVSYGS